MAQKRKITPVTRDESKTLRACLQQVQKKRANKPQRKKIPVKGPPLTEAEAELMGRLAPLLAKRPRRTPALFRARPPLASDLTPLEDSDVTRQLARAIYEASSDPDQPLAAPQVLPDVTDDMVAAPSALPRATIWLQRSRRSQARAALRTAAAWLTTIVIVAAIVGGTGAALIGLDKSRHLLDLAVTQTRASLRFVSSQLALDKG